MIYSFIMICSYDLLIFVNLNFYYDLFLFLTQDSRRANYFYLSKDCKENTKKAINWEKITNPMD